MKRIKYFVAWKNNDNKLKHFGTLSISDRYYITIDKKVKNISAKLYFEELEDTEILNTKSIIKIPENIEYEILSPNEFESKYKKDKKGYYKKENNYYLKEINLNIIKDAINKYSGKKNNLKIKINSWENVSNDHIKFYAF